MGKSSHWSSAIISPTRILELRILKTLATILAGAALIAPSKPSLSSLR